MLFNTEFIILITRSFSCETALTVDMHVGVCVRACTRGIAQRAVARHCGCKFDKDVPVLPTHLW